ncbi:MAG: ABC transporter permease, partial [Flavobacteriales bacterium]
LAYLAYVVLRNSITDEIMRAKVSAVYNIFAFVMMVIFVFILPRMTDSLHPGNGGNPAFSGYDLDSTMRMVFYPATIGWILLGLWISEVRYRMEVLSLPKE